MGLPARVDSLLPSVVSTCRIPTRSSSSSFENNAVRSGDREFTSPLPHQLKGGPTDA